jgi:hypothetical protein
MAAAVASSSQPTMDQNTGPAWGSYLYQNFLLPALSPNLAGQWLTSPFGLTTHEPNNNGNTDNTANPTDNNNEQQPAGDYFGSSWHVKSEPTHEVPPPLPSAQSYQTQLPTYSQSQTPSWSFFGGGSIPTSFLTASNQPQQQQYPHDNKSYTYDAYKPLERNQASGSRTNSAKISPLSVEVVDDLVASPSPMLSSRNSPTHSPNKGKRRAASIDSNEDHYDHDHEVPEGVERDGMIWGMKVEDYRALSARERKRVRNRISARTFRAKRKGKFASRDRITRPR